MVGLIILCLFLAGLAGALFSRLRRVNARWVEFSNVLERLGQGDLSASVPRPEGRIYLDIAGHIEEIKGRLVRLQNQHSKENLNLRGILDSMIEGVMVVDNLGKIRLANERLKNLFAMEESPHGRSIMEASRNHRLQEVFLKASKVGRVLGEEIVISPSIGQELYFELNALRLEGEEEQFAGVVFVFHDITRIRRLETTRREFVTNASHELRTPLSIIKGYVETLADGAIDDPKTARKFVGIMHKHTERLTELVEDMLDLSRLESGRQELRPEKVDIRPLLLRLIQSFHTLTSRKKITIFSEVLPGNLSWEMDARLIERVVFNLMDNAIKYSPEGSEIRIRAHSEADEFYFSIADNGPGIPPESLPHVFERFYRVDKARSNDTGGTGLGLSIAKHIIQKHNGKISAESKPGQGATFSFTIPRP